MKIILAALNSRYIHSNLAIRYIKNFAKEYDIELFEATINENPMDIAIKIASNKPDIVGFSCYIWNIENTLKVCSTLKKIDNNMKILLGGPEVSYDGEKYLKNCEYIDFIIEGEGEITFKELLYALKGGKELNSIDGIAYRIGDKIMINSQRALIENLDMLPFPYYDDMPDRIIYYEASRGCPFSCKYCLSSTIKGVRYFSLERVKRDLKYLIDRNVKLVKFVDRTFNANKSFAKEVWTFLIQNHKNTTFHFEIAADLFDCESLELLKKVPPGLFQFEVGVQTTNPEVLKNINRVMDFEAVKRNINEIKKGENIHCHLDLIAGLPGENMDSFKKSFNDCMKIKPDVLQLGFLKILKGSPMEADTEKYDIHYIDYPPYTVLYTKDIAFNDMKKLINMEAVFDTYYNSGIFKLSMEYVLSEIESAFEFFMDFSTYLSQTGFFDRNFDIKDRFSFFLQFSSEYADNEIIRDLLLHDFVINTKKSSVPDFLRRKDSKDIKNIIMHNKDFICKKIGSSDIKKMAYFPVKIKISRKNENLYIEKVNSIVIFNLNNERFFYI